MRLSNIVPVLLPCLAILAINGCTSDQTGTTGTADSTAAAGHDHENGHDHEHEGPHGGHIIELGSDAHHAELTHDDESNRVGVYILDGEAKTAAPIQAESLVINVSVDGKPTQYTLPAVPQEGQAAGTASYFELESEPLNTVVSGKSEAPNTRARINVTIDGKPYVGMIETEPHEHDHDHDHDH